MELAAVRVARAESDRPAQDSVDADPTSRILRHREILGLGDLRRLFSRLQRFQVDVAVRRAATSRVERGIPLHRVFREMLEHRVFAVQLSWREGFDEYVETLFSTQFGICRSSETPRW